MAESIEQYERKQDRLEAEADAAEADVDVCCKCGAEDIAIQLNPPKGSMLCPRCYWAIVTTGRADGPLPAGYCL